MKRLIILFTVAVMMVTVFTACECKHSYIERDGRVICEDCNIVCVHNYEQQGEDMFCTICMYKCKHTFKTTDEGTFCTGCNTECVHSFTKSTDGTVACETCGLVCEHNYVVDGSAKICTVCSDSLPVLTLENVGEYFSFDLDYRYEEVTEVYTGGEYCNCHVTVKATSKQNVRFNNVVLTYTLVSLTDGWNNKEGFELTIPPEGSTSITEKVSSTFDLYIYNKPRFEVQITGVSGEIVS